MNGRLQRTLLFASLLMVAMPPAPAEAGGGCHSDQEQSARPVAGTEVRMERMCFTPAVLNVDPGATVRFSNQDDVVHVALGTGWGSGEEIRPGKTVAHRFPQRGIYAYSCNLHPGMNGAIVVGGSDAATSDGATSDGATSDGATSDGATSDGATSDGATSDDPTPDMPRATAVVAGDAPAELASSPASPASGGPDARFLAVGGVAGALFGSLATSRWAHRRRRG